MLYLVRCASSAWHRVLQLLLLKSVLGTRGDVRSPNRSQDMFLLDRPRQLSVFSLWSGIAELGIVFEDAESGSRENYS